MAQVVSIRQQAYAFRELATLVGAGISLREALAALCDRPVPYIFRKFLERAQIRVGNGEKLSAVMKAERGMFSDLTIALIEAGETSGRLDEMLANIATYLEREVELRNMMARETFYPKILITATLFIPLGARAIIEMLRVNTVAGVWVFLKGVALYAAVAAVPALLIVAVYRSVRSSETGRNALDAVKLSLPLLGPVIERLALSKFARAFGVLYAAGVHYPRAVELGAEACGNRYIGAQIRSAIPRLERGATLSDALSQGRLSRSLLVRLLQTGEQTGNIDGMMAKTAQHYEDEAHTQIRRLAVTVVPVAVIIMGLIIGAMVLRFYVDLYSGLM